MNFSPRLADDSGATATEYGLIAVVIITAVTDVGTGLNATFSSVAGSMK